jgi:hypothetical protein
VKEKEEHVFVCGKVAREGGEHKWKKKNVNKMQPVKHVIKPILAASRRKRPTHKRN